MIVDASTASLRAAGFSFAKVAALKDLAAKTLEASSRTTPRSQALSDDAIIERLTQVRGIGRWTVEMLLMFRLGAPGRAAGGRLRRARRLPRRLRPACDAARRRRCAAWGERWRPYRCTAAWYLWRALELKRAGTLPAPAERIRLPRIKKLRRKAAKKQSAGSAPHAAACAGAPGGCGQARAAPRHATPHPPGRLRRPRLGVELQEIVPLEAEFSDGWLAV